MNQPEEPRGNLFDLFLTPEERALRAIDAGMPLDHVDLALRYARDEARPTERAVFGGFGSRGHGRTTALTEATIEWHAVTVRAGDPYESTAERHLRLLDQSAPTSKAGRRFIAQQRAAYAKAEARERRAIELHLKASLASGLARLEATIMRGRDGTGESDGDAVAEAGEGADREAAGPAGG